MGEGSPKTRELGEESHPLEQATGGKLSLLTDRDTYPDEVPSTHERWIQVGFLRFTRIFLSLQKEIRFKHIKLFVLKSIV